MSWSILDPTYKGSIWREAGRQLDPTAKDSAVGKLLSLLNKSSFPTGVDAVVAEIESLADSAADKWSLSERRMLGQKDCESYVVDALVVAGYSSDEIKNKIIECGPEVFQEAARLSCQCKLGVH